MDEITFRAAIETDLDALLDVMNAAIAQLQAGFLSPEQIASSRSVMGLDRQLVADRTYFIAQIGGAIAGCGGWSRRATLYGGDHSAGLREPRVLDPATEPARIPLYVSAGYVVLEEIEDARGGAPVPLKRMRKEL